MAKDEEFTFRTIRSISELDDAPVKKTPKKRKKVSGAKKSTPPSPAPGPVEADISVREEIVSLKEMVMDLVGKNKDLMAKLASQDADMLHMSSDKYRETALKAIKVMRDVAWRCSCKKKAYLNKCNRYSCRHIHQFFESLSALLEEDGLITPIQFVMPKATRRRAPSGRSDHDWENDNRSLTSQGRTTGPQPLSRTNP